MASVAVHGNITIILLNCRLTSILAYNFELTQVRHTYYLAMNSLYNTLA